MVCIVVVLVVRTCVVVSVSMIRVDGKAPKLLQASFTLIVTVVVIVCVLVAEQTPVLSTLRKG